MMQAESSAPFFVISLDFELFWGMYDVVPLESYRKNILGVRQAVPAMLRLFREFGIHTTWATVGFVTFANKRELLAHAPDLRPEYLDRWRDPYAHLQGVGQDETSDPYHFGYSLLQQVMDTPGMELASHTFSHLRVFEPRRNRAAFRADLVSSLEANARFGIRSESLVFPRNQYDDYHLGEAAAAGFTVYRGTEGHRWYRSRSGRDSWNTIRAGRLLDAYANVTGHNVSHVRIGDHAMVNVPSSRFLRPVDRGPSGLEWLRRRRILESLRFAARTGGGFHLWWHPHNFGADPGANLSFLRAILEEFRRLREERGMCSLTMAEASRLLQ